MAGKGIEINMLANDKDFQRGVKDVSRGLEEVGDSLNEVSKYADKTGRKLGDEISDGAKDAERSVEKLEKSFKEVADASKRETGRAGDAMRKNTNEATTQAARDLGELKDEAVQNASETFSSFDGSVDSLVDGLQGTFGGIVSNMGAAGAVAGGLLAVGIGYAVAQGEELAEAINTAKERSAELAAEILDVNGDLSQIQWAEKVKEWGLAIEDSREWWEFWQGDAKTALDVAAESADKFGLSLKDVALGLSGTDSAAATRSITELREQVEELTTARSRSQQMSDREDLSGQIRAREELISKLEKQGGVTEEATRQAELLAQITEEQAAADKAAADALQARNDAVNSLQGELDEAINSWGEYYDAETGAVDPAGYIAAMQARAEATTNFNSNVQALAAETGLSFEATQAILEQGVDFAPILASIMAGGPEMRAQYAGQMQAMVDGGQSILDGTPMTAEVTTTTDTAEADSRLDKTTQKRDAPVTAKPDTAAADAALDAVAKKQRTASIAASVDLSSAEAALSRFVNRTRVATVTVETRDREGRLVP